MIDLIHKAQSGDWDAVCAIVEKMRERIERMAAYYAVRCGEDAGDLTQEAWLGMLEALQEVDTTIGDPQQYLLKRAKWRMLDYVKWNKRRQHESLEEVETFHLPSIQHEAVASALSTQFVKRLSIKQQQLVSHLLAGDTWREAAAKMGCTSANVAYHVRQIQRAYVEWAGDGSLVTAGDESIR
jgi:RNA polymerase sigma-70 factor (ECF subfamily)